MNGVLEYCAIFATVTVTAVLAGIWTALDRIADILEGKEK